MLSILTLYQLEQQSYEYNSNFYTLYMNMHILSLHIMLITNIFCLLSSIIFRIFYIFIVKVLAPGFHCSFTLLLGSPSQGPAIYVPPVSLEKTICNGSQRPS